MNVELTGLATMAGTVEQCGWLPLVNLKQLGAKNMAKKKRTKKRGSSATRGHDYRKIRKKIQPVDEIDPDFNVVLYGKAGTGKTTLAASFPAPVLIIDCSEKGTDSVRDVEDLEVLRAETWEELDDIYWYLKKEEHGFKTVVIDTVSQAQGIAIKAVMEEKGKSVEEGALGNWGSMTKQDWGSVATRMKTWIISMRDLEDTSVVFIAHDRVTGGEEDDDENIIAPSVGPALSPSVASTLNASVSTIGNLFIRERMVKKKVKGKSKKTKQVRKIEYCIRLGPHALFMTKVRKVKSITLPDVVVNPTFDKISSLITGGDEE